MQEPAIKKIVIPDKALLPKKFNYQNYIKLNPDLKDTVYDEDSACLHYLLFGKQEKRPYQYKHIINVDKNFDEKFYLSEYPDVAHYFRDAVHIPLRERLFHHYINYGKHEGRFQNQHQQNSAYLNIDNIIDNKIYNSPLTNPVNTLDVICLLTTAQEIKTKRYSKFINHLLNKTYSNNITKSLTFNIVLNTKVRSLPLLTKLRKIFKQVNVINLNINKKEDIYSTDASKLKKMPKYGLKSGPNISFFRTLQYCYKKKYNTCLLLETDCILGDNWIDRIYHHTKYSNGFLISGAIYDGEVFVKAGSAMMTHINGGSGLYAVNNEILHILCDLVSKFIMDQVSTQQSPGLAYDYAFKILIDYELNNSPAQSPKRNFWQFVNRNYTPNKLIFNYCVSSDINIDINAIITKYNPAILHKK